MKDYATFGKATFTVLWLSNAQFQLQATLQLMNYRDLYIEAHRTKWITVLCINHLPQDSWMNFTAAKGSRWQSKTCQKVKAPPDQNVKSFGLLKDGHRCNFSSKDFRGQPAALLAHEWQLSHKRTWRMKKRFAVWFNKQRGVNMPLELLPRNEPMDADGWRSTEFSAHETTNLRARNTIVISL